ncbi:hypothetical protein EG335_19215 [Pectobacterium versatile]|nr:hypothetical protein EG335_19215 [Pectobacterium versatile]
MLVMFKGKTFKFNACFMFFKSRPGTIDLKRIKTSTYVQCRGPPKGGFFVPETAFPNILPNMIFACLVNMQLS